MTEWKSLTRHPLSAEYHDLAGEQLAALESSILGHGFDSAFSIVLHNGQILDGWQRQIVCLKLGIVPAYRQLPEGISPEEYVALANDCRRHETAEQRDARLAARRKLVADIIDSGGSTREAAKKAGISQAQARKDHKKHKKQNKVSTGFHPQSSEHSEHSEKLTEDVQGKGDTSALQDRKENCENKETVIIGNVPTSENVPDFDDEKTPVNLSAEVEKVANTDEPEPAEPSPETVMKERSSALESFARKLVQFFEDNCPDDPWLEHHNTRTGALRKIKDAATWIRSAKCTKLCAKCNGEKCPICHDTGIMPEQVWNQYAK